ncbi:MAG TPA: hypothetical protein VEI97_09035 [bacterium]|nr:hypothetical protein [bacterium]
MSGYNDTITGVELLPGSDAAPEPSNIASATGVAAPVPSTGTADYTNPGSALYPTGDKVVPPNPEVMKNLSDPSQYPFSPSQNKETISQQAPPPPAPIQAPPQQQQQASRGYADPYQLQMENYALQTMLGQYETTLQQYGELDRLLRAKPHLMDQVVAVLNGEATPQQTAQVQQGLSEQKAQDASGVPPAAPQANPQFQQVASQMMEMKNQIDLLNYQNKITQMQRQYGPAFNPRAVVAHAINMGLGSGDPADLDRAFYDLVGRSAVNNYRQQVAAYRQAQQTPPTPPRNNVVPMNPTVASQQVPPSDVRVEPPAARAGTPPPAQAPSQTPSGWPQATGNVAQALRALRGAG